MTWLEKDYKEPETSNYVRFDEGSNRIRILSEKIMGQEYWKTFTIDGKQVRKPVRTKPNTPINVGELEFNEKTGEPEKVKFFWAMVVWNYNAQRVQILEITQSTIRKAIVALCNNPKWGDPTLYDLDINRDESTDKTSYQVTPEPKEKVDPKILEQYKSMTINLEALYEGKDPFAKNEDVEPDEVKI